MLYYQRLVDSLVQELTAHLLAKRSPCPRHQLHQAHYPEALRLVSNSRGNTNEKLFIIHWIML